MEHSEKSGKGARLELGYLHGGEVVYQPGESLGPRNLLDFELVYIIEGTVTYRCADECHTVEPGGVILGRPGCAETDPSANGCDPPDNPLGDHLWRPRHVPRERDPPCVPAKYQIHPCKNMRGKTNELKIQVNSQITDTVV